MDVLKTLILLYFFFQVSALEYQVVCQNTTSCDDYKSILEAKLKSIDSKEELYQALEFELKNPVVDKLAFTFEKGEIKKQKKIFTYKVISNYMIYFTVAVFCIMIK